MSVMGKKSVSRSSEKAARKVMQENSSLTAPSMNVVQMVGKLIWVRERVDSSNGCSGATRQPPECCYMCDKRKRKHSRAEGAMLACHQK